MSISDKKITAFAKKVADLTDKPNQSGMTAAQVKSQFDAAPEELRGALNGLIDILIGTTAGDSGAKNIGSETIAGLAGTTIYDQLVDIKAQLNGVSQGAVPDNSLTTTKYQDLSVTKQKIATKSVDETKMEAAYFAPVGLAGATSPSRYVGATVSGAPVSGTFVVGDVVIDQSAVIWVCTVGGTPGTWKKIIAPTELYVPLWVSSSSFVQQTFTSASAAGSAFAPKGASSPASAAVSEAKLITPGSNWPTNTKFAFECALKNTFSNSQVINAALWDFTTGAVVPGSTASISSNSLSWQEIRSAQFSLTPGRQYGVTFWQPGNSSTTYYVQIMDASLIVLP